jgi:hypothetical protein
MKREELARQAEPASLIESLNRRKEEFQAAAHEHPAEMQTVREETYRGHKIVVRTTYRIEVDGRPVSGHLGVTNDGQVHYHPLPNYSFASAVDLVKQLIEVFPEDFPEPEGARYPDSGYGQGGSGDSPADQGHAHEEGS